VKRLLITDSMTAISADAYRVSEGAAGLGEAIAHRAGFGRADGQAGYVILVRLTGEVEAHSDWSRWGDATMRAAHHWLAEHFDEHPHGGELNVEALRLAMEVPA